MGLSACLGLAGCEQGAVTDTFELSGRVTVLLDDGEASEGIGGASVIFRSDTLLVSSAVTDDSGRYRMQVLTDHAFGQVRASADGFVDTETTVLFDSPQRRVDLALRRAPD